MNTKARVTIFDADKMDADERKQIAAWLKNHAALLLAEGNNYASRFIGRYIR